MKTKFIATLVIGLMTLFSNTFAQNGEWHIVLVGATEDLAQGGIGNGVQLALSQDRENFSQLAQTLGLTPVFHEIRGYDLNGAAVRQKASELAKLSKTTSGKFMLTWVSHTHGLNAKNTNSPIPWMLCEPADNIINSWSDVVNVSEVYESLRQSNFDHVQVFAELCNNLAVTDAPQVPPIMDVRAMKGGQVANLEELFYSAKTVLMTSSVYGQYSYMDDVTGGWFSNAMFESLQSVYDGDTQPYFEGQGGFFEAVITKTEERGKAWNIIQTPQGFVEELNTSVPQAQNNDRIKTNQQQYRQAQNPNLELQLNSPTQIVNQIHRGSVATKRDSPKLKINKKQTKASW